MSDSDALSAEQAYWNERYDDNAVWSGKVNLSLIIAAEPLTPGRAIELACGEGADAVWLAEHGWQVTAVDFNDVALERTAALAKERGVQDRVETMSMDLSKDFPSGEYDFVSMHYLHSHGDLPWQRILHDAARAVAPEGTLLVVGHCEDQHGHDHDHDHDHVYLPSPEETIDAMDLSVQGWEKPRIDHFSHPHTNAEGQESTKTDYMITVKRQKR